MLPVSGEAGKVALNDDLTGALRLLHAEGDKADAARGMIHDAALNELLDILRSGDDAQRALAADALAFRHDAAAIMSLALALRKDPDDAVKGHAIDAIVTIAAQTGDLSFLIVNDIARALNSHNDNLVFSTAESIIALVYAIPSYASTFAPALFDAWYNADQQYLVDQLTHTLIHIGPHCVDSLVEMLGDRREAIRKQAIYLLGEVASRNPDMADDIMHALEN